MVQITSSEKTSIQSERKKKLSNKEMIIALIAVVIFIIVLTSIGGGNNKTSSTTGNRKLSIGEEGIINFREDKSDCSGEDTVVLGVTKEAQDKVGKALLAEDYIGIRNLLLSGEAFGVNICTKAKVIDSDLGIRQVRILEGENFGNAGWLPYEWIK